jgi:hypothetical protein
MAVFAPTMASVSPDSAFQTAEKLIQDLENQKV